MEQIPDKNQNQVLVNPGDEHSDQNATARTIAGGNQNDTKRSMLSPTARSTGPKLIQQNMKPLGHAGKVEQTIFAEFSMAQANELNSQRRIMSERNQIVASGKVFGSRPSQITGIAAGTDFGVIPPIQKRKKNDQLLMPTAMFNIMDELDQSSARSSDFSYVDHPLISPYASTAKKVSSQTTKMPEESKQGQFMAYIQTPTDGPEQSIPDSLTGPNPDKAEEAKDQNEEPEDVDSKQFVENLIKKQEKRYHKQFAFERGQFLQCIPNPDPKRQGEMITVQLVNKVLSELQPGEDVKSTHYQKYELQKSSVDTRALYGEMDTVSGVSAFHYGKFVKKDSQCSEFFKAMKSGSEYAIIAHWEVHQRDDTFKCYDFYFVPSPCKRTICKSDEGTELSQILYSSPHTKEVFFFCQYPNPSSPSCAILRNSLNASTTKTCEESHELRYVSDHRGQAFCELCTKDIQTTKGYFHCDKLIQQQDETEEDLMRCDYDICLKCGLDQENEDYEEHDFRRHCQSFVQIDQHSILGEKIEELNTFEYEQQEQQPSPTLIHTVSPGKSTKSGKTVVFTAYRLATGKNNWSPSIFFHDLDRNEPTWQIQGAEIFVGIKSLSSKKKVTIVTNEIWHRLNQEEYEQKVNQQTMKKFSRHKEYNNYMIKVKYGDSEVNKYSLITHQQSTKLNFQDNSRLDITRNAKVIEAYAHNTDRLTLLYKNLGTFTFKMNEPKNISQPQSWFIKCGQYQVEKFLRLQKYYDTEKQGWLHQLIDDHHEVKIVFDPLEKQDWKGHYIDERLKMALRLEDLVFKKDQRDEYMWTIEGRWFNNQREITLEGEINKSREIKFTLNSNDGEENKIFEGIIEFPHVHMEGQWRYEGSLKMQYFEFDLFDKIKGKMELNFRGWPNIKKRIQLDLDLMKIYNTFEKENLDRSYLDEKEDEKIIEQFYAVSKEEQMADVCFIIQHRDVNFLTTVQGKEETAYVQSNLTVTSGAENSEGNGLGIAECSLCLYNVSEKLQESNDLRNKKEPLNKQEIKFCLKQTFMRTQERNQNKLWHVGPSTIGHHYLYDDQTGQSTRMGLRLFGSVIHEDYSTDDFSLNFFTASLEEDCDQRDYPQQPLSQLWIVDYPILAYKTVSPMNNEIAIIHMAQDMPQRLIDLGQMEFVCFVNHTQMAESRLFGMDKETNCDIMFLVLFNQSLRLVSFKSNPWLKFDDNSEIARDSDIYKHDLFMFSGSLNQVPDFQDQSEDEAVKRKKFCRQFSSDKIQSAQLITEKIGDYEQYMVIFQFNDSIAAASLNTHQMKIACNSQEMVRLHMLRGYDETVFYCENNGTTETIVVLGFNSRSKNEIIKEEIWQLNGRRIVAFDMDNESIRNDHLEDIKQSLFVMDHKSRLYFLQNTDGDRYEATKTFELSQHKKLRDELKKLDNDWNLFHMTESSVTLGDTTYNIANELTLEVKVPKIDQEQVPLNHMSASLRKWVKKLLNQAADDQWKILRTCGMALTTNTISMCQRGRKDFCFLVKPAAGTRKISIVSFKFLHAIQRMIFTSNDSLLCKFRDGQTVQLSYNGNIINQNEKIQKLFDVKFSILAEQVMQNGNKLILLEQSDVEKHILIQFNQAGEVCEAGIFENLKIQMQKHITDLNEVITICSLLFDKGQVASDLQIQYSKEFFITPDGDILKFAAVSNPNAPSQDLPKTEGQKVESMISVFTVARSGQIQHADSQSNNQEKAGQKENIHPFIKVVVLHCRTPKEQKDFVENTQICVVGHTLCYRKRDSPVIQIVRLRDPEQSHIPATSFLNKDKISRQTKRTSAMYYRKIFNLSFDIEEMLVERNKDFEQIQMTEVAKSSPLKKTLHKEMLLQITVRSQAILIGFNGEIIEEMSQIENIDQLLNPDNTVSARFAMTHISEANEHIHKREIISNHNKELLIWTLQEKAILEKSPSETEIVGEKKDGSGQQQTEFSNKISGMLYRTFSEMNLRQLQMINETIESRQKINHIDDESIVSRYGGHTIFSIFWDRVEVFEQIRDQLKTKKLKDEKDHEGQSRENSYLRRLYRILKVPVGDIKSTQESRIGKQIEVKTRSRCQWFKQWTGIREQPDGVQTGYKPITKKCLHFERSESSEILMEIAMMCKENSLSDFVGNITDFTVLLKSMSPIIQEFIKNSFTQTRYTQNINNLDWKIGEHRLVFGSNTQLVSKDEQNIAKWNEEKKHYQDRFQNRLVEVNMLDIGWIFSNDGSIRELIAALKDCPYDSLFSTDLVISLMEIFGEKYKKAVFYKCFLPYVFYFLTTVCFLEFYASPGITDLSDLQKTYAIIMASIMMIFNLYFMFYELCVIARDGIWSYLDSDFFNYVDMITSVMNTVLVISTFTEEEITLFRHRKAIRSWTAFTVLMMWTNLFDWFNLFDSFYSLYWRVIKTTLVEISSVLIIFVLLLMAFGNALMIMNDARYEEEQLFQDFYSNSIANTLMNQYMLALGEFNTEKFRLHSDDIVVWLLFIFSTFIVQILFLNLLIAAMGDTYDMCKDTEKQAALQSTIQILSDYATCVPRYSQVDQQKMRFIYTIQKRAQGEEELGEWEGKLAMIKRHFNFITDDHNNIVTSRIQEVDDKMRKFTEKFQAENQKVDKIQAILKTKLTEVQNNQQQLSTDMNEMETRIADKQEKNKQEMLDTMTQQFQSIQETMQKVLNENRAQVAEPNLEVQE